MTLTEEILSQLDGGFLSGLRRVDELWRDLRLNRSSIPTVVTESKELLTNVDFDVAIAGGTLGILLAAALQFRGWRVVLLERGILRGRDQEWNISRKELEVFCSLELLSAEELEAAIATKYEKGRISFFQGYELTVTDVLNIGVDPVFLLETLKKKFIQFKGKLLEKNSFLSAIVHPDGVRVTTNETSLTTRLLIDAMGHFSPIVKQVRGKTQPDGVCLVVGSCGQGYRHQETGDLIVTITPIQNQCQYFWEAFPARDGRTTYLFTYVDAHPNRIELEFLMEEYLRLLPEYQETELSKITFKRFLYGFFPSYRNSPLKMPLNRILAVGDSAASQSPVSFGGFGSMVRHLSRLTFGIDEALKVDTLERQALALLQPSQPNISVTWLFQKAMTVGIEQNISPNQINDLMSGVFEVMDQLGENVLKPFLMDVIQFSPLAKTLPRVKPSLVMPIIPQVGIQNLLDWSINYFNLGLYSGLYPLTKSVLPIVKNLSPVQQYYYHRWLDALKYGSGGDYEQ